MAKNKPNTPEETPMDEAQAAMAAKSGDPMPETPEEAPTPATRKREPLPDDPHERFIALAKRRMGSALYGIDNVGKVAASAGIKYDEKQVAAMETALKAECKNAIERLRAGLAGETAPARKAFDF